MVHELERRLVTRLLKPLVSVLLLSLLTSFHVFSKELVLVSATTINYKPLSSFEVRKFFLGYPVIRKNVPLIPIINISDKESYQIFLQKIIHLSAKNYERRLLSKTFRTGIAKISAVDSLPALKNKLLSNHFNISVMWLKDTLLDNDLNIIQVLWKEGV